MIQTVRSIAKIGERWVIAGCGLAAFGVAFGALGAHALEAWLPGQFGEEDAAKRLGYWETGVRYQMYHAIGLVLIGLTPVIRSGARNIAGGLMLLGTILFSGCLYGWVLTDIQPLVSVVPIGGVCLIISWLAFASGFVVRDRSEDDS